jgi:hypothetical protein
MLIQDVGAADVFNKMLSSKIENSLILITQSMVDRNPLAKEIISLSMHDQMFASTQKIQKAVFEVIFF